MPKLFIANCTKKNQQVHFRVDVDVNLNDDGTSKIITRFRPASQMPIAPGRQEIIGGELTGKQIDNIVIQLRTFGLAAITEIPRLVGIVPFIFNVGAPVKEDHIRYVMARNEGLLIEQGKERRAKAAVATNTLVTNMVQEQMARMNTPSELDPSPKKLEVEFEQLDQSEAGERLIGEGYRMDPNAPIPAAQAAKAAKARGGRKGAKTQAGA